MNFYAVEVYMQGRYATLYTKAQSMKDARAGVLEQTVLQHGISRTWRTRRCYMHDGIAY